MYLFCVIKGENAKEHRDRQVSPISQDITRLHGQRLESSQSTPANIGMAGSRPAGGISDHFPQHSSQQVLGSKLERSEEVRNFNLICVLGNLDCIDN